MLEIIIGVIVIIGAAVGGVLIYRNNKKKILAAALTARAAVDAVEADAAAVKTKAQAMVDALKK